MTTTGPARTQADPSSQESDVIDTIPAPIGRPEVERAVDRRRLRSRFTAAALGGSVLAALGEALGTVLAGRLAENPAARLVGLLAICLVGSALLDTAGRTVWAAIVDRAEGRLRGDLLDAALHQPLAVLSEQAVGELLDRVDDDTHEVGTLLRSQVWDALRTGFGVVPLWVVAGLTWWPAWLLFPLAAGATFVLVRPMLGEIRRLKVVEEIAWTDHAAALEEGVAGRDDLRASLGQAHVVRRLAELSSEVHRRFADVLVLEGRVTRRTGVLLHALLAAVAVVGVALTVGDDLSVGRLVTLFLVTSSFVGQVDQLARHLPDLQAGLGAVVRLRQLLQTEPEPQGGLDVVAGSLSLRFRDLHFAYPEGAFALHGVDLTVPAGQTLALVGRTGSGKSTLASLVSRAAEPEPGSVLLGGVDVLDLDLQRLRATVGVVTQRTEILVGTLAENIALFAPVPRARIEAVVAELSLDPWVAGLPAGLDTVLGAGGTVLSSGEEQLVSFARLLVRDVQVVVLDEATARMDPLTESLVVRAAERLLRGRTGLIVAHRLSTTARAERVAVLESGRVVQQGSRIDLAATPGPFRTLLDAAAETDPAPASVPGVDTHAPGLVTSTPSGIGAARRQQAPPQRPVVGAGPGLARGMLTALRIHPRWGLAAVGLFFLSALTGAFGALTGFLWGHLVQDLTEGRSPMALTAATVVSLMLAPLVLAEAIRRYPRWWIAVMLRARMAVLVGQTRQHRLPRTPAGEVVARVLDADRYARYADRWVDLAVGLSVVVATGVLAGSLLAGAVLLAVMTVSALAATVGRPVAGRSAAASSTARASFGRSLVSVVESARTVKLAAATPAVRAHLRRVDGGRVQAAVREHRVQAVLDGVPLVMVQCGVVAAWAILVLGGWDLATALLVTAAVNGFAWFGRVAGSVITEAPGVTAWQQATCRLAGGGDLMEVPDGVDLVAGIAPPPQAPARTVLRRLSLRGVGAVHDDGTVGVSCVDLEISPGELVLLVGQVGSGKSSLLSALAGLVEHTGEIAWNDTPVTDAEAFLRPGRVAHVAQVPRVLSGTFADNIHLDHPGIDATTADQAVRDARLAADVVDAGGLAAAIGHRGVRLSGGQVQRLALARALAAQTEVLLADDVSSALDATTEVELWSALRERGATVVGATSKRAALAMADRVVVLVDGRVAAIGPWVHLAPTWAHLAG